ncbi:hypothetical protein ARMGADRAFT_446414 [Armillaria gallica]|uniref:Uncharacterized protein n=1 Tax=Armillaria gallica TaxID=47427 RepID=A0A2H3DAI2_ARMGA|nr:hypothetical protein ARMGADRAFT_446414 [Armillaria gallica]
MGRRGRTRQDASTCPRYMRSMGARLISPPPTTFSITTPVFLFFCNAVEFEDHASRGIGRDTRTARPERMCGG